MGCDIHMFVEVYDKKSGWWKAMKMPYALNIHRSPTDFPVFETYEGQLEEYAYAGINPKDMLFREYPYMGTEEKYSVLIWRDYELFGHLAGVRSSSKFQIADPRGLPEDVSPLPLVASGMMGRDGHSHSWVTLDEVLGLASIIGKTIPKAPVISNDADALFETYVPILLNAGYQGDQARFVFFFDN